jgi:hypothetical protein
MPERNEAPAPKSKTGRAGLEALNKKASSFTALLLITRNLVSIILRFILSVLGRSVGASGDNRFAHRLLDYTNQ